MSDTLFTLRVFDFETTPYILKCIYSQYSAQCTWTATDSRQYLFAVIQRLEHKYVEQYSNRTYKTI